RAVRCRGEDDMNGLLTGGAMIRRCVVAGALGMAAALGAVPVAGAAPPGSDKAWTSVANTGIVDEANQNEVLLGVARPALPPGARPAPIRYNVTATDGLFLGPDKALSVRFYKPDNFSVTQAR